jgi:5-(carboxyamino)imidazole ribonucleotide synthase
MRHRIAILGGGQLARMTAYAAFRLGLEVGVVARPADDSPAAKLASERWIGDWEDRAILDQVAQYADVVTLENEFVAPAALAYLEDCGVIACPSSKTLSVVQDKFLQKTALAQAGLPVPRFMAATDAAAVLEAGETLGWPLVLKCRRNGYDGYGNELLRSAVDVAPAVEKLLKRGGDLMVEEFVPFTKELAVMVARNREGQEMTYPVVETIQHAHMCHTVLAPAEASPKTTRRASELARTIMRTIDGVGIFGVELFLLTDGDLLINEIAPRPHNSGHFSIEACVTSQFENHVRAILNFPLGAADMHVPAAVMVNILGSHAAPARPRGLPTALSVEGATVHLYGKNASRPGRKMGHVTAIGATIPAARELALRAARGISI